MEIHGDAKLFVKHEMVSTELWLMVKFRLPNQKFKRKMKGVLLSSFWKEVKNFEEESLILVKNKEFLEYEAKDLIIKYIDNKFKKKKEYSDEKERNRLMKIINSNFKITVNYEDK